MRILIVDDETGKRQKICEFVRGEIPDCTITEARSFQSAVEMLRDPSFDLVILDMRLTTYDTSAADDGGRPRNFGGEEIMRKMLRRGVNIAVIVLTQYTIFGDQQQFCSFEQLGQRLRENYPNFYAMIHFSQSTNQWKTELRTVLQGRGEPQ